MAGAGERPRAMSRQPARRPTPGAERPDPEDPDHIRAAIAVRTEMMATGEASFNCFRTRLKQLFPRQNFSSTEASNLFHKAEMALRRPQSAAVVADEPVALRRPGEAALLPPILAPRAASAPTAGHRAASAPRPARGEDNEQQVGDGEPQDLALAAPEVQAPDEGAADSDASSRAQRRAAAELLQRAPDTGGGMQQLFDDDEYVSGRDESGRASDAGQGGRVGSDAAQESGGEEEGYDFQRVANDPGPAEDQYSFERVAADNFTRITEEESLEGYKDRLEQGMDRLDGNDPSYSFAIELTGRLFQAANYFMELKREMPNTEITPAEVVRRIRGLKRKLGESAANYADRYLQAIDVFLDQGGVLDGMMSQKWRIVALDAERDPEDLAAGRMDYTGFLADSPESAHTFGGDDSDLSGDQVDQSRRNVPPQAGLPRESRADKPKSPSGRPQSAGRARTPRPATRARSPPRPAAGRAKSPATRSTTRGNGTADAS
jgi:hypothetical protein